MNNNEANFELYIVTLKGDARNWYSKRLTLDEIRNWLEIRRYGKTYEEYIRPAKLYFTEDLDELAKVLQVDRVVPMGLYIRGVYGGEKKKGEKSYAGLVLETYAFRGGLFEFRLHNISKAIDVPQSMLEKYGIEVYELIYVGEINPFRLRRTLPILLSKRGKKLLKEFLNTIVKVYERNLTREDVEKILSLANEVEQPDKIETLNTDKWYAAYRRSRAFTAFAFKPSKANVIVYDDVGYLETSSEDIAYYYAAILNYLAYCVIRKEGSGFRHHQYARPLLAIYIAGLSWGDVNEATRRKVVRISRCLHEKVPDKEYRNQRVALEEISGLPEFKELVNTLDKVVDEKKLEEALDLVIEKGEKAED